jgi:hypothetical protein
MAAPRHTPLAHARGRTDEHGRDADELQARARHRHAREEAVDDARSQVQRLARLLVLEVHVHQPVKQNRAHPLVNPRLRAQEASAHVPHLRRTRKGRGSEKRGKSK